MPVAGLTRGHIPEYYQGRLCRTIGQIHVGHYLLTLFFSGLELKREPNFCNGAVQHRRPEIIEGDPGFVRYVLLRQRRKIPPTKAQRGFFLISWFAAKSGIQL